MSDTLVVVETFAHDWQAQMAKSVLDQSGIHAVIIDENIYRAVPPSGDARGVNLQVWQRDMEEARRILRDRMTTESVGETLK